VSLSQIIEPEVIARAKRAFFEAIRAVDRSEWKEFAISFFGGIFWVLSEGDAFWKDMLQSEVSRRFAVAVVQESPFWRGLPEA
jgi:hypothetical protein